MQSYAYMYQKSIIESNKFKFQNEESKSIPKQLKEIENQHSNNQLESLNNKLKADSSKVSLKLQ